MSYFAPYLDETGIHMPTYSDWMEYLLTGYRQIFGTDVYLSEDAPDYQLLSLFAKAMDDATALSVDVYSSFNPNWATGVSLDRLLSINGIRRYSATCSTVVLALTGQAEAELPAGMLARDTAGNSWRIPARVSFDGNGTATATAVCTQAGAVNAAAGTINIIETPTSTWSTVTNPEDAIPGRATETDAAVRVRRAQSVGLPGRSILDGIHAALVNLPGVEHAAVLENFTGQTDANGLPAHSVCALVLGGSDAEIAKIVFGKKAPGIATHGNTSVTVEDAYKRENTVKFSRPVNTTVSVSVTLRALYGWNGSYMTDAIKQRITAYVEALGIGEDLVVSALWGEIFRASEGASPAFSVLSVTAQAGEGAATADTLAASYDAKFVTDTAHISITVEGA